MPGFHHRFNASRRIATMKRIIAGLLVLSCTLAAWSADDPKPQHNHLTSGEIADGWLLLFDGETTFGWQSPNGSKWTIAEGILAPQAEKPGLLVSTTAFADYELQFDYIRRFTPNEAKERSNAELRFACDREGNTKNPSARHQLNPYGEGWTTM